MFELSIYVLTLFTFTFRTYENVSLYFIKGLKLHTYCINKYLIILKFI